MTNTVIGSVVTERGHFAGYADLYDEAGLTVTWEVCGHEHFTQQAAERCARKLLSSLIAEQH